MKEHLNKWRDLPFFKDKNVNIRLQIDLYVQIVPIEIQTVFYVESDTLVLKSILKCNEPRIVKTILNNTKFEDLLYQISNLI